MSDDNESWISVDDETYEIKAIKAYERNELAAKDLQASLGVSRAHMFRLIERYRSSGRDGLNFQENWQSQPVL